MSTQKRKDEFGLTQVGIRLGAAHMRKLVQLAAFYGGQTRVFLAALDKLYQEELANNAAFAEFVADDADPAADASEE